MVVCGDETGIRAALTALRLNPRPRLVLRDEDRVVLAATRRGLAELLGRRAGAPTAPDLPAGLSGHPGSTSRNCRGRMNPYLPDTPRWRSAKSSSRRTCLMRSSTTREPWPAS